MENIKRRRKISQAENPYSASGQRGVSYCSARAVSPWRASLYRDGDCIIIGYFESSDEATEARDREIRYPTRLSASRRGIKPAFLNDGSKVYKTIARLYYNPIRSAASSYIECDIGYYPDVSSARAQRNAVEQYQFPSLDFVQQYVKSTFDINISTQHVHNLPIPTMHHRWLPDSVVSCECGLLFMWKENVGNGVWICIDEDEKEESLASIKLDPQQLRKLMGDPILQKYRDSEKEDQNGTKDG